LTPSNLNQTLLCQGLCDVAHLVLVSFLKFLVCLLYFNRIQYSSSITTTALQLSLLPPILTWLVTQLHGRNLSSWRQSIATIRRTTRSVVCMAIQDNDQSDCLCSKLVLINW
jgi:hypothetical protein